MSSDGVLSRAIENASDEDRAVLDRWAAAKSDENDVRLALVTPDMVEVIEASMDGEGELILFPEGIPMTTNDAYHWLFKDGTGKVLAERRGVDYYAEVD